MNRLFQHLFCTHRTPSEEARAFKFALLPHPDNDDGRKRTTHFLIGLWALMTLLWQLGYPAPPEAWGLLTGFVTWRIGKIQEKEARQVEDSETSK